MEMCSSISKLDRDIERSFLNFPSNHISYLPIPMTHQQNHMMMLPSQSIDNYEYCSDDVLPQPHPNARLGFPANTNIIPMYYDVIIDTVTDYDIFYPIAKETKKYYHNSFNDQETNTNENSIYPRYEVQRLDEHALSIDFPHDYESPSDLSDESIQHQPIQYERKNVRFNDNPTWIPCSTNSTEHILIPDDQYYFHPEMVNNQPSVRYITTPFFWFRPVLNNNYAICIPTNRPSLHAYITSSFNPISSQYQINSTPNPIRL